jgi:hypothetical protein
VNQSVVIRPLHVAAIALIVLAGCGGGDHKTNTKPASTQPTAQREAPSKNRGTGERDQGSEEQDKGGASALPLEDRRAFLQLGAASSNLRSAAALMLIKGFSPPGQRSTMLRLRKSVALLRPHDAGLRRLRVETLRALVHGIREPHAARAMLADANRIRQGLKRYSNSRPAIGAIAPD